MIEIHDRKFCVAPIMGYTTPYARKLYRILSKKSFLFTEMIAAKSIFRREAGNCRVCWSADAKTDVGVSQSKTAMVNNVPVNVAVGVILVSFTFAKAIL